MAHSCEQEEVEEETTTSGSNVRTVRKLTEETPDVQSVREVTGTVTEERRVEEIPPGTQEQVLPCLSTERCEVIGESSKHTGKVWQQEAAEEPPPDKSDQEGSKDKEISSEVNQRADRLECIREFQKIMDKAIEQLLNKPARRHFHQKDKPEPCMEQGKHKESICHEAERLPQHNVKRDSDDEQNSMALQETMDTDQCIQRLIRSEPEGSDHPHCKI